MYPYFHYRHENNYFLYELEPLENAPLEGITTETMPVNECCVMYEMLAVAPCPSCSLRVPRCLAIDMWETR